MMSRSSLLFVLSLVGHAYSLIGYDCTGEHSKYTEISLLDTMPCKPSDRNITKNDVMIQLIQPKTFDEVKYFQCLIEIDHFIFRCGKAFDTNVGSSRYSEYLEVSREQCDTLINEGYIKYEGVKIRVDKNLNINTVSIETIGQFSDGSCSPGSPTTIKGVLHDRPVRTSSFKITTKEGVASVDIEESKIILESGLKCNYLKNHCFSADEGDVFWESKFNSPHCDTHEFMAIFEGIATHIVEVLPNRKIESYLLHYDNYDFQVILTGRVTRTCGQLSYQTEHPKLSVVLKEHNLPFVLQREIEGLNKNTNLFTYINSKLVYAMTHVKDQIENLYNKIMFDKCQADNKIIHNMMTLATLSPHQFAYQYFGEEGYTASQRGEVIYVVKCQPVIVNFTRNLDNKCFQEIPVELNGKLLFLSPRSRLLHNEGSLVECSSIMPVKYKIQGNWYSITPGGILTTSLPTTISIESSDPWEFKTIDNFASAGVYSPSDLDKIEKIMLTSLNHEAVSTQLTRAITGGGELFGSASVSNLMTPEELEKFSKSKIEMFWNKFLDNMGIFGNMMSALIGVSILVKTIIFLINPFLNFGVLYRDLGLTWKLLFVWWENLVHLFLRDNKEAKGKIQSSDINILSRDQPDSSKRKRLDFLLTQEDEV